MLFCYAARSLSPFVCPPRNHSQLVLQYRRQLNDFLDSKYHLTFSSVYFLILE
ncbi:hypothetical protein ACS0TY_006909 [Phlomoides rotata]